MYGIRIIKVNSGKMTSYHHEIYNKSGFLFCRLRNRIFTIPDENESFTLRGKNFRRSLKTKASLGDRRIHADLGAASAPSGIMQWRSKIWRAGWNVHWLSTATELELFSGVPCNEMAEYDKYSKEIYQGSSKIMFLIVLCYDSCLISERKYILFRAIS